MGDDEIPPPVLFMLLHVGGSEFTTPIDERKDIPLYVPFGMPTAALLHIATECPVTEFPKFHADSLRLFTSDQNIHSSFLSAFEQ
jgi:hypothetical protein